MYVLYLDESGAHEQASYFVLAGLAVFEREIYWFTQDMEKLQREYFPNETEPVFFHVSQLRAPQGQQLPPPWNQLSRQQRLEIKDKVFEIIRDRRAVLFGCAVEKNYAILRGEDPSDRAFEELTNRFDLYLSRVNRSASQESREEQRGLVVLAGSTSNYEKTISLLARRMREIGTRWRLLRNVTDIPYFAPAKDTRMLQYADFCANAIYGRYNSKLTGDFDRIALKFDREGGVIHGLSHLTTDSECPCLACFARQGRQQGFPSL